MLPVSERGSRQPCWVCSLTTHDGSWVQTVSHNSRIEKTRIENIGMSCFWNICSIKNMNIHTHILIIIYIYIHIHIPTHIHMHTHTYIYVHDAHTCIHMCIYTCGHAYTQIYVHMYIHIYMDTLWYICLKSALQKMNDSKKNKLKSYNPLHKDPVYLQTHWQCSAWDHDMAFPSLDSSVRCLNRKYKYKKCFHYRAIRRWILTSSSILENSFLPGNIPKSQRRSFAWHPSLVKAQLQAPWDTLAYGNFEP